MISAANPLEQLQTTLAAHGQSMTAPRRIVFGVLQTDGPLTMRELIARCGPDIDRASIYRTVALFERLAVVQRVQVGWKYHLELSDSFQHHHHHMFCTSCNQVFSLPEDSVLEQRLITLTGDSGFVAHDHQIEIRGVCKSCQTGHSEQVYGSKKAR
jgi:Fur family ferric uptake transcriptional regulator